MTDKNKGMITTINSNEENYQPYAIDDVVKNAVGQLKMTTDYKELLKGIQTTFKKYERKPLTDKQKQKKKAKKRLQNASKRKNRK